MSPVLSEQRDGYLVATLHRPEARNAIDTATVDALHELCAGLERAPQPLVLTGAGGVFAAGADIRQLRERGPADALAGINSGLFDRIARLPLPTIAAVDGPAIGGGAELAYACDLRLATDGAVFANPEVGLGILAAAGACWRLRDLVGLPVATQMLLAGRRLDAAEALRLGLVAEVLPDAAALAEAAERLVRRIAAGSALALRLTKLALHAPPGAHPGFDNVAQAVLFGDAEKTTRMTAFLNRKGKP